MIKIQGYEINPGDTVVWETITHRWRTSGELLFVLNDILHIEMQHYSLKWKNNPRIQKIKKESLEGRILEVIPKEAQPTT